MHRVCVCSFVQKGNYMCQPFVCVRVCVRLHIGQSNQTSEIVKVSATFQVGVPPERAGSSDFNNHKKIYHGRPNPATKKPCPCERELTTPPPPHTHANTHTHTQTHTLHTPGLPPTPWFFETAEGRGGCVWEKQRKGGICQPTVTKGRVEGALLVPFRHNL